MAASAAGGGDVLLGDDDVDIDDGLGRQPRHRGAAHVLDADDRNAGQGVAVQIVQRLELPWPTRVVWGHLDHPRTSPPRPAPGSIALERVYARAMPGRDPGNDLVAARFSLTIDGVEIAQFADSWAWSARPILTL